MAENRLLIVVHGGENAPSARLRILQYLPFLRAAGYRCDVATVPKGSQRPDDDEFSQRLEAATVVFVQRIVTRRLLRDLRQSRKPVIFDLDDALHYIRPPQFARAVEPRGLRDQLRNSYRKACRGGSYYSSRRKLLNEMIQLATVVVVGNDWLRTDLKLSDSRSIVIPTTVPMEKSPQKSHSDHRPVKLGWIGSGGSLYHLQLLDDVFTSLLLRHSDSVELHLVSSSPIATPLPTHFHRWSLDIEDEMIMTFDIGLMPLQDDPFSRGKCAFKAIYCMSRGIPVVASPVGENQTLIQSGVNGYLAEETKEWETALSKLIEDVTLRKRMGQLARRTILEHYSTSHHADRLIGVVAALANRSATFSG